MPISSALFAAAHARDMKVCLDLNLARLAATEREAIRARARKIKANGGVPTPAGGILAL